MKKCDDDGYDLIDPFKLVIGLVKMLFGLVKALYNGLTSPNRLTRMVTVVLILLAVFFIGFCIYMQNLEMQR